MRYQQRLLFVFLHFVHTAVVGKKKKTDLESIKENKTGIKTGIKMEEKAVR